MKNTQNMWKIATIMAKNHPHMLSNCRQRCGQKKGWMNEIGIEIGFIQYSKLHKREGRKSLVVTQKNGRQNMI